MFYADDAGVASQSPEKLRKMMGMIVVVCAADQDWDHVFSTKGMSKTTAVFTVEAAGRV